jgi:flavin reductase (DIM6/NTAB) family NADH-FMN oxidoreductase RutF
MNAEQSSQDAIAFDSREFRNALGCYATGIVIMTACGPDGRLAGVTVNSFASVSLEPPLVLWSLSLYSPSLAAFQHCHHYAINVLAADQIDHSQRFSRPSNGAASKFDGLSFDTGRGGAPLLHDACAWFECRNETRHPGGDHLIFIGLVEAFRRNERPPLLYHAGRYRTLSE